MRKTKEETVQKIIEMYNLGKTKTQIGKELEISSSTVQKYLKENNIKTGSFYNRLTEEQLQEVCGLYVKDEWDTIFQKYPFLNKNRVRHITSIRQVKKPSYFWSDEDINCLINNFGRKTYKEISECMNNRHSPNAIKLKAQKLGLTFSQEWTNEEKNILLKYYSILPKEQFLKKLPNRTEASVVCMGMKLGVKSYAYLQNTYSDADRQFILENADKMSDLEIAEKLHKTVNGVQEQRRKIGLYKFHKDYSHYENFSKFFRGCLSIWKKESMKNCNYACILTGSKNFVVHHLYGFNGILEEVFSKIEEQNLLKGTELSDYTKEELEVIKKIFYEIHSKYPLGVCVNKDLHTLFHQIYGSGHNTEEQWNRFVEDFYNHKYDEKLQIA